LKIAWKLATNPPKAFADHALSSEWALPLALAALALAIALKNRLITLALVGIGVVIVALQAGSEISFGPAAIGVPSLDAHTFGTAFTALVVPQVALSFANSCLATADAARRYFGERAVRVMPGRLATTLGAANILSGAIAGMPVCHGAGGLTAHYAFGARRAAAPLFMGAVLVGLALLFGSALPVVLAAFPLPILAGLLAAAGILHIGLLRDLSDAPSWVLALGVGAIGFELNLTIALAAGLVAWWLPRGVKLAASGARA
jgi:hypothetical protein